MNEKTIANGIDKSSHEMITFNKQNLAVSVTVKVKLNYILVSSNEDGVSYLNNYSLYQLKSPDSFASIVKDAGGPNAEKIKGWNNNLKPQPREQCCIILSGFTSDLLLCSADKTKNLETNETICTSELKLIIVEIEAFLNRVKPAFSFNNLTQNPQKLSSCSDKNWNLMRERMTTIADHVFGQCKQMLVNIRELSSQTLSNNCKNIYLIELNHEKVMLIDLFKTNETKIDQKWGECIENLLPDLNNPEKFNTRLIDIGGVATYSFKQKNQINLRISSSSNK